MTIAPRLRTLTQATSPLRLTRITSTTTIRMQSTNTNRMQSTDTNKHGQGASHATAPSHVPGRVQNAAPEGLEKALPDKVHPTGAEPGQSTHKTHAKDDGNASIVPKKLQEKLPESVERAVPNVIHDTGKKH